MDLVKTTTGTFVISRPFSLSRSASVWSVTVPRPRQVGGLFKALRDGWRRDIVAR
jgi:hypothetical protein